jgi:hypothetical protein
MSQNLNIVSAFDGTNYGYWKARMRFYLKSIDYWKIVETGWTKPTDATPEAVTEKNSRLTNDKALHALCQALSLPEFVRISNSESAKEALEILETTYEGTKLRRRDILRVLLQNERPKKLNGESWENLFFILKK